MSNSKRKTPKVAITCAESEKENKRAANRKHRRVSKIQVTQGNTPSKIKELSDVWNFDKDGKIFLKDPTPRELRK